MAEWDSQLDKGVKQNKGNKRKYQQKQEYKHF